MFLIKLLSLIMIILKFQLIKSVKFKDSLIEDFVKIQYTKEIKGKQIKGWEIRYITLNYNGDLELLEKEVDKKSNTRLCLRIDPLWCTSSIKKFKIKSDTNHTNHANHTIGEIYGITVWHKWNSFSFETEWKFLLESQQQRDKWYEKISKFVNKEAQNVKQEKEGNEGNEGNELINLLNKLDIIEYHDKLNEMGFKDIRRLKKISDKILCENIGIKDKKKRQRILADIAKN